MRDAVFTGGEHSPTGPGPRPTPPIGRQAEVDRILRSLDVHHGGDVRAGDVRGGLPQALLVLGEAGTGKTQLLRLAEDEAVQRRARVLWAHGWDSEEPQPFASLHQLLLPVLGELDTLPADERLALRTALGPAAGTGPLDGTALRAAVLTLLGRLARTSPVLLAVDDIQDCDRDSMDVLFSVTRRLTDQAVTVLFTARGEAPPAGVPADFPVLPLGPLSRRASARLLDAQPGAPVGRARLDLLRQAEGNPLAIVELSRAAHGGTGSAPGDTAPRRTSRIQQMFAARLDALPGATRRALLYAAAALREDELTTVMAALGAHDLTVWAPAEEAGLITIADGRLAFRNPLMRTAAYDRHAAKARQQAHRDLAAARGRLPAPRAWHLAAAAIGPDESVATALEEAAAAAHRAGDCFGAAKAWEEAARFSDGEQDRARRLARALTAASDFGDPAWVRDLYGRFTRVNRDPELLGVAVCAMSGALSLLSFQREAFDLLLDAWRHTPPARATTSFALAAIATGIARQSGLPEHRRWLPELRDHAVRVAKVQQDRCAHEDGFPELAEREVLASLESFVSAEIAPAAQAGSALRRLTAPVSRPLDGPGRLTRLLATASVAYHVDESELCAERFRQAGALRGTEGTLGPRVWTLAAHVETLIGLGRWSEAEALIEEGRADAVVHRLPRLAMDLEALAVILRALSGETTPGTLFTGPHWRSVSLDENRATHARMLRARGLAAMVVGDAEGAFRHLRALFGQDGSALDPFLSPRSVAELAAAAQRVGRQEEAAGVLRRVRESQGDRPTTRVTLLMHHAAALVEEDADPEHHFRLALVNTEAATWPLERAETRLHYAIWLRRRRRPLEARVQLTAVLEEASRLDARRLAASARGELRASGVAGAPAPADRLADLTAQQQQIARLAANGLSNREIGERLFLSPRTVGSHLYNVYPKLGISSRHQLRDLLHDG
ncbi:AAA family ATPase [Streptomyces sp. ISL-36]|uniref:helix-turn-helix transcriptional regulator n=1 Tax=Streptomyces sp. ISL-36 TaxID=2819182 RepID=UPI0027E4B131|nr:AAA family ATPase [Streptomyces sp. ISL-36]